MLVVISFFGLFSFSSPRALKPFLQVGQQLSLHKKLVEIGCCILRTISAKPYLKSRANCMEVSRQDAQCVFNAEPSIDARLL